MALLQFDEDLKIEKLIAVFVKQTVFSVAPDASKQVVDKEKTGDIGSFKKRVVLRMKGCFL